MTRRSVAPEAEWTERVREATGAKRARLVDRIVSLWSGYGAILRFELEGGPAPTVIAKIVDPPDTLRHPRGWGSNRSHERKLASYRVERTFYEHFARRCPAASRVPRCFHVQENIDSWLFVLEDLDAAGYPGRAARLTSEQVRACLSWLAHFHCTFVVDRAQGVSVDATGLWAVGSYWHLATRPDELQAMPSSELKDAAASLDARLSEARFLTLIHGDAKAQNFCFSTPSRAQGGRNNSDRSGVAAVDFQYVGTGCAMKDVAYFLSSCYEEEECELHAADAVDYYFRVLRQALSNRREIAAEELEAEWRGLYPLAWADFLRFLLGWAPGHYKVHAYSRGMTARALREL